MKNALHNFWIALLTKLNNKINQALNIADPNNTSLINAGDGDKINFFAMVIKKVLNRALMGAEFDVISDSAPVEPLKELCQNLNENAYRITANMIGGNPHSECWVVPAFVPKNGNQKLTHSIISGDRICITEMRDNDTISECFVVLNVIERRDKKYFLCRKHNLDDNGNLTISYFVADNEANEIEANIPEWDSFINQEITYQGANHIGFGRYKSPVIPLNNETVYGVPLNYGCQFIEQKLQEAANLISHEMKASKKMLFPDWSIVKEDSRGNATGLQYAIDGYIYPIKKKAGVDGSLIDEYCPAVQYSAYAPYLEDLLCQYQAQMGVRDLITHTENTNGATATEIKSKNADNLALETSIRKALRKGNIMTLEADSIYLGIPRDLWEYDEDFKDIYEDEQQTLSNLMSLYNTGAIELEDIIKYWFPTYSDEQVAEKIARINEAKANNVNKSIEDMLNM